MGSRLVMARLWFGLDWLIGIVAPCILSHHPAKYLITRSQIIIVLIYLNQISNVFANAKPQVSLTVPNPDHFVQVSLTVLDNFFGCNHQS